MLQGRPYQHDFREIKIKSSVHSTSFTSSFSYSIARKLLLKKLSIVQKYNNNSHNDRIYSIDNSHNVSPINDTQSSRVSSPVVATTSNVQPEACFQQKLLNGILSMSAVPYSSYVPAPITFLHKIDARVKQLWLVTLYCLLTGAASRVRLALTALVAILTVTSLQPRLWQAQLRQMVQLCFALFLGTAVSSDTLPVLPQIRHLPPAVEGLSAALVRPPYRYVLFTLGPISVTQRSLTLALRLATVTFVALQSSTLCLLSTPGEEMVTAVTWWLTPFKILGVPAKKIAFTLLLSLRFLSLAFDEVRNLALGLASRGVDWRVLGPTGSADVAARLAERLFRNMFQRSSLIAQAMVARGFRGPDHHHLYAAKVNPIDARISWAAVAVLVILSLVVNRFKW